MGLKLYKDAETLEEARIYAKKHKAKNMNARKNIADVKGGSKESGRAERELIDRNKKKYKNAGTHITAETDDTGKVKVTDKTTGAEKAVDDVARQLAYEMSKGKGAEQKAEINAKVAELADGVEIESELMGMHDVVKVDDASKPFSDYGEIELALDVSLKEAKRDQRNIKRGRGNEEGAEQVNVLLTGAAGTGKTSRVKAWCRNRGIKYFYLDAKSIDYTDIGGLQVPADKNNGHALRLNTDLFDVLENASEPNTVLFLDELNRASTQVRGSLLSVIENKVIPHHGGTGEQKLTGLLFTVAAINPASSNSYRGVEPMDKAEMTRFRKITVDANKELTRKYLNHIYTKDMKNIQAASYDTPEDYEQAVDDYNVAQGKLNIANTLLNAEDNLTEFTYMKPTGDGNEKETKVRGLQFDDIEEEEALEDDEPSFNPRSLSKLLKTSGGDTENFLNMWDEFCNPHKKGIVEFLLKRVPPVNDKANRGLINYVGTRKLKQNGNGDTPPENPLGNAQHNMKADVLEYAQNHGLID